ncbi:DUF6265 family protein [Algimonas porphyrae]|uniref:DUF6265 domain-containing protein n=1 Tax=Algimonas porphyrae TaxID=1128113 RepID=A0ABQ5V0D4_9PROT|nr:DUF6265 family protein [Algimonas porphyrae]GLQ21004.1 hypothetical protein GCM10007854_19590 [Algimonas porphyrae]
MLRFLLLGLSLSSLAGTALAQDVDWRNITPRLEGCWHGTGMGGVVSECWLVADNGRADGMFLMRQKDAPTFAEIITIDAFDDGVEMRLKHVNADMTGWEEKDKYTRFRFLSAEADRLNFKGLSLIFVGDDRLETELMMTFGDGEPRMVPFSFTRTATVNPPAAPPEKEAD